MKTQVSQLEKGTSHCFCQGLEYEIEFSIIIRHFTIWGPSFHDSNTILFEDMSNERTKLMAYSFKTYRAILIQDFMGLTTGRVMWTLMTNENAPFAALYKKSTMWVGKKILAGRPRSILFVYQTDALWLPQTDWLTYKQNKPMYNTQTARDWLAAGRREKFNMNYCTFLRFRPNPQCLRWLTPSEFTPDNNSLVRNISTIEAILPYN